MIDAEELLDDEGNVHVPASLAGPLGDGLLVLARAAVTSAAGEPVPPAVLALLDALQAAAGKALRSSGVGNAGAAGGIVSEVSSSSSWVSADEAGERVGLSARRVRQLASSGVLHSTAQPCCGAVYVDPADLQSHLRRTG